MPDICERRRQPESVQITVERTEDELSMHRYGKCLSNSEAQDMVGGMMEMKKAGRVFTSGRGPGEGTREEFGLA